GGDRTYESRGPSRPLLSQRSRRRCRQRHPQRRRLQPSPRSRLAEDHFARHPTRATPDLHNSASPQTGFLTGDYLVHPRWPRAFEAAKRAVGVMVLLLTLVLLLTPVPLSNVARAMVISLISLAYVEEDGLLLSV